MTTKTIISVVELEEGDTIEITPTRLSSPGFCEEPGEQPWETEFLRFDRETDKVMVPAGEYLKKDYPSGERPIDSTKVRFVDTEGHYGPKFRRYGIDFS